MWPKQNTNNAIVLLERPFYIYQWRPFIGSKVAFAPFLTHPEFLAKSATALYQQKVISDIEKNLKYEKKGTQFDLILGFIWLNSNLNFFIEIYGYNK
jgi:hypothetical protein